MITKSAAQRSKNPVVSNEKENKSTKKKNTPQPSPDRKPGSKKSRIVTTVTTQGHDVSIEVAKDDVDGDDNDVDDEGLFKEDTSAKFGSVLNVADGNDDSDGDVNNNYVTVNQLQECLFQIHAENEEEHKKLRDQVKVRSNNVDQQLENVLRKLDEVSRKLDDVKEKQEQSANDNNEDVNALEATLITEIHSLKSIFKKAAVAVKVKEVPRLNENSSLKDAQAFAQNDLKSGKNTDSVIVQEFRFGSVAQLHFFTFVSEKGSFNVTGFLGATTVLQEYIDTYVQRFLETNPDYKFQIGPAAEEYAFKEKVKSLLVNQVNSALGAKLNTCIKVIGAGLKRFGMYGEAKDTPYPADICTKEESKGSSPIFSIESATKALQTSTLQIKGNNVINPFKVFVQNTQAQNDQRPELDITSMDFAEKFKESSSVEGIPNFIVGNQQTKRLNLFGSEIVRGTIEATLGKMDFKKRFKAYGLVYNESFKKPTQALNNIVETLNSATIDDELNPPVRTITTHQAAFFALKIHEALVDSDEMKKKVLPNDDSKKDKKAVFKYLRQYYDGYLQLATLIADYQEEHEYDKFTVSPYHIVKDVRELQLREDENLNAADAADDDDDDEEEEEEEEEEED